ncbi:hypothetical protein LINGRAHAP2_LOCUS15243 [Linum grandiflorum]
MAGKHKSSNLSELTYRARKSAKKNSKNRVHSNIHNSFHSHKLHKEVKAHRLYCSHVKILNQMAGQRRLHFLTCILVVVGCQLDRVLAINWLVKNLLLNCLKIIKEFATDCFTKKILHGLVSATRLCIASFSIS